MIQISDDTPIWQLTIKDLRNLLELSRLPAQRANNQQTLITKKVRVKQLAEIYGWGESTIYKWCKAKKIPHFQVDGNEIWFDLEKIELWIEKDEIKTKDEIVSDWEAKKQGKK